jgi:hypothetical protein
MKKTILKIFVKAIQSKNKMIGIFHKMIIKMSGNGLQIQILRKMKMNIKSKNNNNRKSSKLREIKIC